jgi:hypothetical protein
MSQKPHEAKASRADILDNLSESTRAPGHAEAGVTRSETRERAQQGMRAPALLGPAGCLGVLSGTAQLSELPDQPED